MASHHCMPSVQRRLAADTAHTRGWRDTAASGHPITETRRLSSSREGDSQSRCTVCSALTDHRITFFAKRFHAATSLRCNGEIVALRWVPPRRRSGSGNRRGSAHAMTSHAAARPLSVRSSTSSENCRIVVLQNGFDPVHPSRPTCRDTYLSANKVRCQAARESRCRESNHHVHTVRGFDEAARVALQHPTVTFLEIVLYNKLCGTGVSIVPMWTGVTARHSIFHVRAMVGAI